MTHQSAPELLVLHAVRLEGFVGSEAVANRAGTSCTEALRVLREAESNGWVQYVGFGDLAGWSLTDQGKAENEQQLATERDDVDPAGMVAAVYRNFLPLNACLLRAVTDWQIKPTGADRFAPNEHDDRAWDRRVLDALTTLGSELEPLTDRLSAVFARFDGYAPRYATALDKARNGKGDWVDKTDRDSCHRVWFQLHEDFVATLGINRRSDT